MDSNSPFKDLLLPRGANLAQKLWYLVGTVLKESISRILSQRFVTAKELASVAGQLISMFLAIGNTARLMSRSMYSQISEQEFWFCPFTLHDSVKSEL